MTIYSIKRSNGEALIEIKGHAGYANKGEDIVCAAISTACIMTANLIDKIKEISYVMALKYSIRSGCPVKATDREIPSAAL